MSAAKDKATQIRGLADEIINEQEESGDVVALRAEAVKLRGLLRGTYHAAELLNNKQLNPMYDRQPTPDEANAINATVQTIRHATGEYSGESQVIIGETTEIEIPDMFGDVLGHV